MTPDVNVLLAASRTDHAHHKVAFAWFSKAVDACAHGKNVTLLPMVVASFLRLTTNAKIFVRPTPIADAIAFIDSLLAVSGVEIASSGSEWLQVRTLCLEKGLRGNDIPDAWLAATVVHTSEHLVTFDRDFRSLLPRSQVTLLATG